MVLVRFVHGLPLLNIQSLGNKSTGARKAPWNSSLPYFLNPFLRLLLAQAALRAPPKMAFAMRSLPLLLPLFSLLAQSLSLSFPSFAFDPLREKN